MSTASGPAGDVSGHGVGAAATGDRLAALLEEIDLSPFQKELLRDRWLAQVTWMSKQAKRTRTRYYWVRLPVVIGGLLIPGLISLTFASVSNAPVIAAAPWLDFETLRLVTFGTSLLIAALAATEEVFHFGDRWRHYRRTSERLKGTGWRFLMLNAEFRRFQSHTEAFVPFTESIEGILGEEVEGYMGQVVADGNEHARHEVVA